MWKSEGGRVRLIQYEKDLKAIAGFEDGRKHEPKKKGSLSESGKVMRVVFIELSRLEHNHRTS